MEELYRNETFKTILFYSSIIIYTLVAITFIVQKYFPKSKGIIRSSQKEKVDTEDVRDLFAFEMPKGAKSLKADEKGDKPETSEYDIGNNFFKDGKKDLDV